MSVAATVEDLIADGRAALRKGDVAAARGLFQTALTLGPNSAALEGLGFAATLRWISTRQSTSGSSRTRATARMATVSAPCAWRMLGYLYGIVVGDWAIGSGWIARAQHLEGAADSSERGWVELTDALEVAFATHDNDLAFAALAYLGASLVHADQVTEGMVRLDESLAAVAGGEVEDLFVIEEIFCQMFSACERAHDVARAEQSLRVGEAVAAT